MLEIYRTENENLYGKLRAVLSRRGLGDIRIMHNANGKPYLEGNPLFFSLSHSGSTALIAVCDNPVGIDSEIKREKKLTSVLSRFPDAEKKEIFTCEDFLKHWVVREAYIKMLGLTLAEKLKDLSYVKGTLYDGKSAVKCGFLSGETPALVYCVCTQAKTETAEIKYFV